MFNRLPREMGEVMFAEISAGLGSLKTAKDFIQALNGIQTAAAVNDAKLTLQGLGSGLIN